MNEVIDLLAKYAPQETLSLATALEENVRDSHDSTIAQRLMANKLISAVRSRIGARAEGGEPGA